MEIAAPAARKARMRGLDHDAFEALLAHLGPDRERAGEKYEAIRYRLVRFFICRGAAIPDELADEAIDRVGRKLAAGEVIRIPDVGRYFLGVARNVLREAWDEQARRKSTSLVADTDAAVPVTEPQEPIADCLERCLDTLPPESKELLLRYYAADPSGKAAARKAMAEGMGVGVVALRLRLHRLRAKLEACIRHCLEERGETSSPAAPSPSERKGAPR
jgi:DNA-directed RNA polymerase specialized sigma24 family protein